MTPETKKKAMHQELRLPSFPRALRATGVALAASLLLAACGSGGGGDDKPVAAAQPVSQSASADAAAQGHFERLNEVRVQMGLPALRWNAALARAAQGHANYLSINHAAGHEQVAGASGFTGTTIAERTKAAGYTGTLVQETKANSLSDSTQEGRARMDALLLAPLHRLQLLAPDFDEAAVGVGPQGSPLVTDLGASGAPLAAAAAARRGWMVPFEGQTQIAASFAPGSEEGMPAGLPATTGTPLTLSGRLFSMLTYSSASLQEEATGEDVELLPLSPAGELRGSLIFLPKTPLKPGTRYVWTIAATVDRDSAITRARFTTAP